jgi:tRNA-dihydrouridine synthase
MKFYLAPLEGLTGYVYRNAYHKFFDHIDKYYSPFIVANQSDSFKAKDINDILPEHNEGINLIPQILTNNAKDFIHTSKKIKQMGYDEVNLNLGCPSGTVVAKGRGSGFLAKKEELNAFLDEIFSAAITKISVKTRIGKDDPEEFYDLLQIYNKYPMEEVIIHPRIQKDFYKNKPNLKIFSDALSLSKNPVCYNGDIVTKEDYDKFTSDYSLVDTIMIGRGLIRNPGLINNMLFHKDMDKAFLKEFHDEIYEGYKKVLFGDRNILFKMKEIWFYMSPMFTDYEKYAKKIKKSERLTDYDLAVSSLFREQELKNSKN